MKYVQKCVERRVKRGKKLTEEIQTSDTKLGLQGLSSLLTSGTVVMSQLLWLVVSCCFSPLLGSRTVRYVAFNPPVIYPQVDHVTVEARSNYTLTCEGVSPVTWITPPSPNKLMPAAPNKRWDKSIDHLSPLDGLQSMAIVSSSVVKKIGLIKIVNRRN